MLSAVNLSELMIKSLPQDVTPQLKDAYEAVALAAHASLLAVSFRLVGLGEDHKVEARSDQVVAHSDPTHITRLPAEWNATKGAYAFRYSHDQSSMEYVLKVTRMGSKAVIMGMGIGDDRTCSCDLKVHEYVSDGNLPATLTGEGRTDEEARRKLMDVLISVGRLSDLGSLMRVKIIQKITPSLNKEGYEEGTRATQTATSSGRSRVPPPEPLPQQPTRDPLREDRDPAARPYPLHDPLAAHPRRPMPDPMPGFEDEFETQRGPRGIMPGTFPRIGDRDLYPPGLGPHDPIRGGIGPGLGGPMGGGGMYPTFGDFAGQGQQGGYDPRSPPGSRYDPTGPSMGGHPRGAGKSY